MGPIISMINPMQPQTVGVNTGEEKNLSRKLSQLSTSKSLNQAEAPNQSQQEAEMENQEHLKQVEALL